MHKNFLKIIFSFSLVLCVTYDAIADVDDDLLLKDNNNSQTIHELYTAEGNQYIGSNHPSVILVEFFDYHCGYCRNSAPLLKKLISRDKRVQIIFKEYPVLSDDSFLAAKAALAAGKQHKYLAMHDAFLAYPNYLDQTAINQLAKKMYLDLKKFAVDLEDEQISSQLERNAALAEKLSVTVVPTFIIANAKILTSNHPALIPQYRWTGSIDDAQFVALLNKAARNLG